MSIFLSVYTQTHPNLPSMFSLLAICFHTDDFSHVLKSTTQIFSGRKVSKVILFSGQLDIVEFHKEDISRTKTREKNQGIFFLSSQIQKRFIQTFSIFLSSGTDERKNVKKE